MTCERQNPLANTDSWRSFGTHTELTLCGLSNEPISCGVSRAVTQNVRAWLGRTGEARPSFGECGVQGTSVFSLGSALVLSAAGAQAPEDG